MVQQFLDFKKRNYDTLRRAERINKAVTGLETSLALKTPVTEAEFAIDERTPLSLYDCLVPRIKEHRRFRITQDSPFSIADFKAQQTIRQLDYEIEKKRLPRALEENAILRHKVTQMESECDIVRWYLSTMERGVDTKIVVKEFATLREAHDELI